MSAPSPRSRYGVRANGFLPADRPRKFEWPEFTAEGMNRLQSIFWGYPYE